MLIGACNPMSHIPSSGQTGSGKTFTMMGPPNDPELAGVNRRAVYDLFKICEERADVDFELHINMVEIYNDNIFDLLAGILGLGLSCNRLISLAFLRFMPPHACHVTCKNNRKNKTTAMLFLVPLLPFC